MCSSIKDDARNLFEVRNNQHLITIFNKNIEKHNKDKTVSYGT